MYIFFFLENLCFKRSTITNTMQTFMCVKDTPIPGPCSFLSRDIYICIENINNKRYVYNMYTYFMYINKKSFYLFSYLFIILLSRLFNFMKAIDIKF